MTTSNILIKPNNGSNSLFIIFSVWSFIFLCRPQDYLPFIGYLRPNLTLGLLTLFIFLLNSRNDLNFIPSSQFRRYFYLVAVITFSVPFSLYRRGSLMSLITYSSVIIFFFLFYRIVNNTSKLRSLLFLYCSGVSVYALYILNSGSYTGDRITFGSMFDPNDIAYFILSFIVFNIIFLTNDNPLYKRIISFLCIIISLLVILKTGSRGGLIALIIAFASLLFSKTNTIKISFFAKTVLVVIALLSMQFMDMKSDRYKSILDLKSDYNVSSEEGRIAIWKIGMRIMLTHPFTGVGFNQFSHGVGKDREARNLPSARWQTTHNSLVQIGAETGLIGFILFIALSYKAYKIFIDVVKKTASEDMRKIGVMAKAGFIGHFVSAMFLSQAYSVYWAFYIVLSAVLKSIMDNESKSST